MSILPKVAVCLLPICDSPQATPRDFFGDLKLLCGALSSEGLRTGAWKNPDGFEYFCITPYVSIGSAGSSGMESNIAYYVIGKQASRANQIKLVVNVNNSATRGAANARLLSATESLFRSIGVPIPNGRSTAVKTTRPYSSRQAYGTVSFAIEKGRIETWTVAIRALSE